MIKLTFQITTEELKVMIKKKFLETVEQLGWKITNPEKIVVTPDYDPDDNLVGFSVIYQ